jgi:hypothetical protein
MKTALYFPDSQLIVFDLGEFRLSKIFAGNKTYLAA